TRSNLTTQGPLLVTCPAASDRVKSDSIPSTGGKVGRTICNGLSNIGASVLHSICSIIYVPSLRVPAENNMPGDPQTRHSTVMSSSKRPVKIIGCGAHGRVVADLTRAAGEPVSGFLDDNPGINGNPSSAPANLKAEGPTQEVIPQFVATHGFVVAIGDAAA